MHWYLEVFKKYADFSGRARRAEYWMFTLVNALIVILASMLIYLPLALSNNNQDTLSGLYILFSCIFSLYGLAIFIPTLAVTARRLHDTDRSGWYILISWIPLIGSIILLVFLIEDSQPGTNQYGPNPKEVVAYS